MGLREEKVVYSIFLAIFTTDHIGYGRYIRDEKLQYLRNHVDRNENSEEKGTVIKIDTRLI